MSRSPDTHAIVVAFVVVASLPAAPALVAGDAAATNDGAQAQTAAASQIQYAPASVSVTAVSAGGNDTRTEQVRPNATVPAGNATVVSGTTNLQPDDNAIAVDLLTPEGDIVVFDTVDRWGMDGEWTATLNTTGVEAGSYVVEVTAADTVDRVRIELTEPSASANATEGNETTANTSTVDGVDTAGSEADATDSTEATDSADATTDSGSETAADEASSDDAAATTTDAQSSDAAVATTQEDVPGFGVLGGVLVVFAVALAASRRRARG